MEILIVTPQVAPYSLCDGVGEVSRALPRALHRLGHSVTVLSPLYRGVDPSRFSLARRLNPLELELGGQRYTCEVYDGKTASGVGLLFLGSRELFAETDPGESSDEVLLALQTGLLCRAAIEIAVEREPAFDLIQAHEQMAALALVWAAQRLPRLRRILLAHDLLRQGRLGQQQADRLGLSQEQRQRLRIGEELCLLKGGILAAHRVASASPAAFGGLGSEGDLAAVPDLLGWTGEKLAIIENGLDTAVWNPLTDVHLRSHFDPINPAGKANCKAALQYALALPVRHDVPLILHIGEPCTDGAGELVASCAAALLSNDVQLLVCRQDSVVPVGLSQLAQSFPDRFKLLVSQQLAVIHRAIAASDLLLLSPEVNPYRIWQMCAHRYGSLPIGRAAGSVADTVVDCDSSLHTGSGFLFQEPELDEMVSATRRAVGAFYRRQAFEQLRAKAMRIDHSWERAARRYHYLYQGLVGTERDVDGLF